MAVLLAKVSYEPKDIQEALGKPLSRRAIFTEYRTRPQPPIDDYESQQRVLCRLIDAGGDPNGEMRPNGWPLLHCASMAGQSVIALQCLLEKGANPNRQGVEGKTALHVMFSSYNNSKPETTHLQKLLQHGALPELADDVGETGLHAVANRGDYA